MANPLAEEARTLPDSELDEALNEAYRELFNLQFQRGTRQLQNPMALRAARRQVARLHTIRRERARAAAGAPLAPLSRPAPVPPPIQPEAADEQPDDEQPDDEQLQDDLSTDAPQDAQTEPVAAAPDQQDAGEPAAEAPSAEAETADAAEAEAPADTADPQTEPTKDA